MKTPEETTLHQTILNECREEVAKEYGMTHRPFKEFQRTLQLTILSKAAELALDRQAEFYEDMSNQGWRYYQDVEAWIHTYDKAANNPKTTKGLYDIWEGETLTLRYGSD